MRAPFNPLDALALLPPRRFKRGKSMAQTKFSAGQRALVSRGGGFGGPTGAVSVVSVLPREAGPQQYRVRADGETFERVIEEGRLEAVNYD
jgi:hypothetical protein